MRERNYITLSVAKDGGWLYASVVPATSALEAVERKLASSTMGPGAQVVAVTKYPVGATNNDLMGAELHTIEFVTPLPPPKEMKIGGRFSV